MDPKITSTNKDLDKGHDEKDDKYDNKWIGENYIIPKDVDFMGVALDWTGAWSPKSHRMLNLGFDESFSEAISMETIYESHSMFQIGKNYPTKKNYIKLSN